jgi:hypothetical protein
LELALPILKKKHLTYDEVAGKTVQFLFGDLLKDSRELNAETLSSSCFMNDGKGNFIRSDLPDYLQLAPIFSFSAFSSGKGKTYFGAGNFYGVQPYEGRYDALNPTLFDFNKKTGKFRYVTEFPAIGGEARDAKWINYKTIGKVLIMARNNDSLIFLKP